jgi:hypothetical protein
VKTFSTGLNGVPTFTYGLDGEGRTNTITASSGQSPVTPTTYNVAGQPTKVTPGSHDDETFTYDPNTYRMSGYIINVHDVAAHSASITYNANGSIGQLVTADPNNSAASNETCTYSYDDLARMASSQCINGATPNWGATYSYTTTSGTIDPFGNIRKDVPAGYPGTSFLPTYDVASNRFSSIPGVMGTLYDANGNLLQDSGHNLYKWDAANRLMAIDAGNADSVFDALDRRVEYGNTSLHAAPVPALRSAIPSRICKPADRGWDSAAAARRLAGHL